MRRISPEMPSLRDLWRRIQASDLMFWPFSVSIAMILAIWVSVRFSLSLISLELFVLRFGEVLNSFFLSCFLALLFFARSFFYLFLVFSFLCIFSINFISSDSFRENELLLSDASELSNKESQLDFDDKLDFEELELLFSFEEPPMSLLLCHFLLWWRLCRFFLLLWSFFPCRLLCLSCGLQSVSCCS